VVALAQSVTIGQNTYTAGTDHTVIPARDRDQIRNPLAWVGGTAPALSAPKAPGKESIGIADLSTPTKALAALGLSQTGVYVATDPRWGYAGGVNIAAACQAAINAMPSSGPYAGGILVIPAGNWDFEAPVVLKSGVHIVGAGQRASRINARSGGMFTWSSSLSEVVIEHLQMVGYDGHLLHSPGGHGIDTCKFRNLYMRQEDVNSSIMQHVGEAAGIIRVDFEHCYFTRSTGSLVSAFRLVSAGGAINDNQWSECWAHSHNCTSSPFFYIESTAAQSYVYGNVFKNITGEQSAGGLIDVRASHGLICERVVDYDTSVTPTADLIRVGKSTTTPLKSLSTLITSCGRVGGIDLPGGIYDVNLVPGEVGRSTVIAPHHSSSGFRINFGPNDPVTVIDAPAGSWSGQDSSVGHYFKQKPQFAGGLVLGSTVSLLGGTGSPAGAVSATTGSVYANGDGGAGRTLYVKEAGSSTTGWGLVVSSTVPNYGSPYATAGEASCDRQKLRSSTTALTSGAIELAYFVATKSETINSLTLYSTGTAASGLTLARYCVYSVASNGDLSLVASTTTDTTLLTTTNTAYPKALAAPWAKVAGQPYAVGVLLVGTTMPTMVSFDANPTGIFDTIYAREPRLSGRLASQTDLQAGITAASLTASRRAPFVEMLTA
jgi:hypothetical protein